MLDLTHYGSAAPFTWSHKDLVQLVTAGSRPILTDPLAVNAFRILDRAQFLPAEYRDLAYHDRLIKVGYGEVSTNPTTTAQIISLLKPKYGGKYLHLGSGTGYLSSLLGYIAGDAGGVYSMERLQWFWEKAREFSKPYRQNINLELLYRDGSQGLADHGPYDGIVVSFVTQAESTELFAQLNIGGKLLMPLATHELKIIERIGEEDYIEELIPGFSALSFGSMKTGVA